MAKKEKNDENTGRKEAVVIATVLSPLRFNDTRYEAGTEIKLSAEEFEKLEKSRIAAKRVEE